MEKIEWVDLSDDGFQVLLASFEQTPQAPAIAVRGDRSLSPSQTEHLRRVGFRRVDGPHEVWARKGNSFKLSELAAVFPRLRIRPMDRREFHIAVRGANPLLPATPAKQKGADAVETTEAEKPSPSMPPAPEPQASDDPFAGDFLAASSGKREISLPVVEDLHDGILEGELEKINRFQARYIPKSKLGASISTIPVNLALATQSALSRLEEEKGEIDAWVMKELQWSRDELERYLSPEQIDAVALGIRAAEHGKGFILADQTGLGKGRVMAALLRWSVLRYGKAVFLTEKANLFTDIWRDIDDIGSSDIFGEPLMMNDKASIIDQATGEVLFKSKKPKELSKIMAGDSLPENSSLLMATYSQFNRKGSAKAAFLSRVIEGTHLFVDECHNMVNDSNTRNNLMEVLEKAEGTTFSSATFARNALNMGAYRPVFPASISSLDLVEVLKSGGAHMLEALSQSLAEEGLLVRREHDLSDISINVLMDEKRADEHREMSDHVSPILADMARLAHRVEELVEDLELTKQHRGERYYVANFGVRLAAIVRQFLTALSVDQSVEKCIEILRSGAKPVVVIENTMESLMREIASEDGLGEAAQPDLLEGHEDDAKGPPTFRDALALMLERMMQISYKRAGEDPERLPVTQPDLVAEAERIREAISRFPDLPLSPIDDIRERVEQASRDLQEHGLLEAPWHMGEISARKLRVSDGQYVPVVENDRNQIISAFNAGDLDGLVLTKAASTGLSLHASERVQDQRRRVMLELQIPSNVVDRVQFWGRINRRGQVNTPEFYCLSTVLPYQVRLLANQNSKVAELSANVTANTQTALSMDVPDIINSVGNDICKRLLEANPKLARRMGIALRVDPEQAAAENYHVNKLLSRLVLLPSQQQEQIYQRVISSYQDVCRELSAKGMAPGRVRQMEGKWNTVSRHLFDPGMPEDGAVFGRPVYLTTLARKRHARPIKGDTLRQLVSQARKRHQDAYGDAAAPGLGRAHLEHLEVQRGAFLKSALPSGYETVLDALKDSEDNAVKRLKQRLDAIGKALKNLEAGHTLTMSGEEGEVTTAMVLDITLPEIARAHVPSAYNIRYLLPGDERPREMSLAALFRDPRLAYEMPTPADLRRLPTGPFDAAPAGKVEEVRRVLDGNLFSAVRAAKAAGLGNVVEFEDDQDRLRRGVLIPRNRQDHIHTLAGTTRSPSVVEAILREGGGPVYTNPEEPGQGLTLHRDGAEVLVTIPGKKKAAKPFMLEALLAVTGDFEGDFRGRDARIPPDRLSDLLEVLIAEGHSFHYSGRWRMTALEAVAEPRKAERANQPTP